MRCLICLLRNEAHAMILQLQKADPQHTLVPKKPLSAVPSPGQLTITLEG
jgi:hypothetical protein